jgi:NAD(P)-dependent dehydrogenase (short-subunit alcohol dehydrogenase family)
MNPVEEDGNQFAQLFEKMPAKRVGRPEDIAGAILYLGSQAGVRMSIHCDFWAIFALQR